MLNNQIASDPIISPVSNLILVALSISVLITFALQGDVQWSHLPFEILYRCYTFIFLLGLLARGRMRDYFTALETPSLDLNIDPPRLKH